MKPLKHNRVLVASLNPHPRNSLIYGDENVSELAEHIRSSGWIKPLVVTTKHTIISGHRRWKAVFLLGWETVPVEYREFLDETAELEALLLENASRFKNYRTESAQKQKLGRKSSASKLKIDKELVQTSRKIFLDVTASVTVGKCVTKWRVEWVWVQVVLTRKPPKLLPRLMQKRAWDT